MNKKFPKQNENKNKKEALFETMETKNEVLRFEPGNYDKIALFSSGGFWSATQNSCLYMLNIVKIKTKMHVTYDKYIQRERVYISCHCSRLASTQELLDYAGCKLIRDDEKIKVYLLPEKVTPEKVREWAHDEETRQKK